MALPLEIDEQPTALYTINYQLFLNLFKTNGIVLRTLKYGETSVIVSIFTDLFGTQSYLVNGIRTSSKKAQSKANLFQPGAILQLVVYHNELKKLQRIKETNWKYLYENIFFNVAKNAVAMFIVELLWKCLKQPETSHELFQFSEDILIHLDLSSETEMANYPLFFAIHLATFLGLQITDNYSALNNVLDLQEGLFIAGKPQHPYYVEEPYSNISSQLLKIMQPHELVQIKVNKDVRRVMMTAFQNYYALHIQDFGVMKSVPVLQAVISG
ncbi:MAG TPA: DNA repair protein RecO [Puia sp.]|nr:DNA repair protein RecO [Puia sp.]